MLRVSEYYLGEVKFLHIHLAVENDFEGIDVYLSAKLNEGESILFFHPLGAEEQPFKCSTPHARKGHVKDTRGTCDRL